MSPLHRALALAEREDRSVRIGEQLDLDVPRPLDVPLAEDAVVAECSLPSRRDAASASSSSAARSDARMPRPPPPAAALTSSGSRSPRATARGRPGRSAACAIRFAASLSPPSTQRVRGRPDPRQSCGVDRFGEVRALGEKAVPGMNRVGACAEWLRECAPPRARGSWRSRPSRPRSVHAAALCRPVRRRRRSRSELSRAARKTRNAISAAVRDEQLADQAFFPGFSRFCGSNARLIRTVQLERAEGRAASRASCA